MKEAELRSLLQAELGRAGIELPAEGENRILAHASLLAKWNKAVRLIGSLEPATLVRRHILESLALLPFIHERKGALLDIGSGNGYPAIPLKCALPELRLAMMEPTMRKGAFLRTAIADLGLADAEVIRGRVDRPEDLARYGRWDCITMRAVAAIPHVMAGAPEALRRRGRLIFLVGDEGRAQILGALHGSLGVLADSLLPETQGSHIMVVGMSAIAPDAGETVH